MKSNAEGNRRHWGRLTRHALLDAEKFRRRDHQAAAADKRKRTAEGNRRHWQRFIQSIVDLAQRCRREQQALLAERWQKNAEGNRGHWHRLTANQMAIVEERAARQLRLAALLATVRIEAAEAAAVEE